MKATVTFTDESTVTLTPDLAGVDRDGLTIYVVTVDRGLDEIAGVHVDELPGKSSLHIGSTLPSPSPWCAPAGMSVAQCKRIDLCDCFEYPGYQEWWGP